MAIKFNKKAFVFTVIAIFIMFILTIIFFAENRYHYRQKEEPIESRIITMNTFIDDLYNDIGRAGYISTYRSLIALEDYMSKKGTFFNNLTDPFVEAFMYGTINNEEMSLMENTTFENYQTKVNNLARQINLNLTINATSVSLYHESPWTVTVAINLSIDIYDMKQIAEWHLNKTIYSTVPIIDIKDPLYTVNTRGRVPNTIKSFPYSEFINDTDDKNDTHYLQLFINESYYINSTRAPSFLMRFTNDISASTYGIESIVDLQEFIVQNATIYDKKSAVDFMYFNSAQIIEGKVCNIQNMPGLLRLDNTTLTNLTYELYKVQYNSTCT